MAAGGSAPRRYPLQDPGDYHQHGGPADDEPAAARQARLLRALTSGGIRQSVLTLTSTAIGGGLLTLPYAMRLTGMGLGIVLLLLSALSAVYSIQIIMTSTVETGSMQYGDLVAKKIRW